MSSDTAIIRHLCAQLITSFAVFPAVAFSSVVPEGLSPPQSYFSSATF